MNEFNNREPVINLSGDITVKILLESLAEGVVIINEMGKIVLVNTRFSDLTGFGKQEVVGQSLNIFLPDGLHQKHDDHIARYFGQPKIRPMGVDLDLIAKRKDNTLFPVEISLSFLNTESGKLGFAFITDISSRKKAEEELKTRNQELDAYARNVAHDLNSPLLGLIGFSEFLLDYDHEVSAETRMEYLKIIAEGGRNMSNIIREMLIFATLKKQDVHQTKVFMNTILENVLSRLRFPIEQNSVVIKINEPIADCLGYAPWIEEIWFNYLSNAIKYGGTPPIIEIGSKEQPDGFIKYCVKDNGSGISDEFKAIAFNSNNPAKDKISQGFGLGLSIVKSIVEKLGGNVDVASDEGKGCTFSFSLKKE
jgi:PAS domain S-box-containing protein